MSPRLPVVVVTAAATLLALVAPVVLPTSAPAHGVAELKTAVSSAGDPKVGPLFHGTSVNGVHSCTASVIDSPTRDLILTAAHCVSGAGTDIIFAPGFRNGRTPYGVWHVTESYVDPSWVQDQNPHDDYAVLRVNPDGDGAPQGPIESVTGGTPVAPAPRDETPISLIGYNAGVGGTASACHTELYWRRGFPEFSCAGFVDGSSGSPWLATTPHGTAVVGVIGGPHQGGCLSLFSAASDFRQDVGILVARAAAGRHPDILPSPGPDGC